MNDIEQKIVTWRKRLSAALSGREETVRELEAHLRDHIEVQGRHGVPAEVAFEQGVKRLGEPRALAREFGRGGKPWYAARPEMVIYSLMGAGYAAVTAMLAWRLYHSYNNVNYTLLLVVHMVVLLGGYLSLLTAGMLGFWALVSSGGRPGSARRRAGQRREIFRMTATASVLVPIGMVLGMVWAARHTDQGWWSWAPVELGALCILASAWLLLLVQFRVVEDERIRASLAVLGAVVVVAGWLAKGWTSVVPMLWLCGTVIMVQGAIALLHRRSTRARANEPWEIAQE